MLDVHPPHHTPNSWRDFFLHIATIVVGLVIAVGLEQTVEAIHHHHQIVEAREALAAEREENYKRLATYVQKFQEESQRLTENMQVLMALRGHRNASPATPPARLAFHVARNQFETSAWHMAQSSGVLPLMPKEEVLANETVYNALQDIATQDEEEWIVLNDAARFQFTDPDASHLTQEQLAAEVVMLQRWMMKHFLRGNFMQYPHRLDSRFDFGPTDSDLDAFHHSNTATASDSSTAAAAARSR